VKRIIAFIPPEHLHLRLILELEDQIIVLHEATVAAITRAYIDITTHPLRKAVELERRFLGKDSGKKPFYARSQLLETNRLEKEIVDEALRILARGKVVSEGDTSHPPAWGSSSRNVHHPLPSLEAKTSYEAKP